MARVDDFYAAAGLAKKVLEEQNPKRIADRSGAGFIPGEDGGAVLTLKFLNRDLRITWPGLEFSDSASGDEVSIQQQVLLLHYLEGAGAATTGRWIAYQEVPDGKFYLDAFLRRAKNPLVQGFGENPERLVEAARELYAAQPLDQGDVSVAVTALPTVPVALILWKGDEEFPPEGTILFDRNISGILSAEDIAWLAGMVVYPLLGMAGKR